MPWIPRAASAYIHTSSSAFSAFARPAIHLPLEQRQKPRERNAGRTLHASLGDRGLVLLRRHTCTHGVLREVVNTRARRPRGRFHIWQLAHYSRVLTHDGGRLSGPVTPSLWSGHCTHGARGMLSSALETLTRTSTSGSRACPWRSARAAARCANAVLSLASEARAQWARPSRWGRRPCLQAHPATLNARLARHLARGQAAVRHCATLVSFAELVPRTRMVYVRVGGEGGGRADGRRGGGDRCRFRQEHARRAQRWSWSRIVIYGHGLRILLNGHRRGPARW
jgi:hypothetical protein